MARNHGQDQVRAILAIMMDGLFRFPHFGIEPRKISGVQISIPEGEAAAGNIQAQLVAFFEDVTGGLQVNRVLVNDTRLDQLRLLPVLLLSEAGTKNAFSNVDG